MNPPLRASSHSTSRTLDTRASIGRPATSNRMLSPTLILKRSWMLFSIETSRGLRPVTGGAVQKVPSMTFSFGWR